jgi:hypothetical protein
VLTRLDPSGVYFGQCIKDNRDERKRHSTSLLSWLWFRRISANGSSQH